MTRFGLVVSWLAISTLAQFGCTSTQEPSPTEPATDRSVIPRQLPAVPDRNAYERLLQEAREWQRRAAAVDGEWRDVEPLIQRAQQAAAAGNFAYAVELVESARFQAEMGFRQMKAQEQVGNPPFLYY